MGINIHEYGTNFKNLKDFLKAVGLKTQYNKGAPRIRECTTRLTAEQRDVAKAKLDELYPHSLAVDCLKGFAIAGTEENCVEMTEELRECSESLPGTVFVLEGTDGRGRLLYASVIFAGEAKEFTDI